MLNYENQLELYQTAPYLFNEDEVDDLERQGKRYGYKFNRDMKSSESSLGSTLNHAVSGVVEGFTTLGWAGEASNSQEAIAGKIGHLIGFAPDIIIGALAMLSPIPGDEVAWMAYMANKYAPKAVLKAGVAVGKGAAKVRKGLEPLVAGTTKAQRAGKAALDPIAEKLLGRALKESPFRLKSVPFRLAELAMERSARGLKMAGWDAAKFMAKHPKTGAIAEEAIRLGLATGISAWTQGPQAMAESAKHGAIAGALFGGIGNFMRIDKLLRHESPLLVTRGERALETVAKMAVGAGFMGGMAKAGDQPTEVVVYETLLGAFFGGGTKPAYIKQGGKHFVKMNQSKNIRDHFDPSLTDGYDTLGKDSQDWVNDKVRKHMGQLYELDMEKEEGEKSVYSEAFIRMVASAREKGVEGFNKEDAMSDEALDKINTIAQQQEWLETIDRSIADQHKKTDVDAIPLDEVIEFTDGRVFIKKESDIDGKTEPVWYERTKDADEKVPWKNSWMKEQFREGNAKMQRSPILKETAEAFIESGRSLDARAKALGWDSMKQLNLNSLDVESIMTSQGRSGEEISRAKELLKERSDRQKLINDLPAKEAARLNDDDAWGWVYQRNYDSFRLEQADYIEKALEEMYEYTLRKSERPEDAEIIRSSIVWHDTSVELDAKTVAENKASNARVKSKLDKLDEKISQENFTTEPSELKNLSDIFTQLGETQDRAWIKKVLLDNISGQGYKIDDTINAITQVLRSPNNLLHEAYNADAVQRVKAVALEIQKEGMIKTSASADPSVSNTKEERDRLRVMSLESVGELLTLKGEGVIIRRHLTDPFRIGDIAMAPDLRGQNKGTRVIQAIKKEFIGGGYKTGGKKDHIMVRAKPGTEGFYEKMGFEFDSEDMSDGGLSPHTGKRFHQDQSTSSTPPTTPYRAWWMKLDLTKDPLWTADAPSSDPTPDPKPGSWNVMGSMINPIKITDSSLGMDIPNIASFLNESKLTIIRSKEEAKALGLDVIGEGDYGWVKIEGNMFLLKNKGFLTSKEFFEQVSDNQFRSEGIEGTQKYENKGIESFFEGKGRMLVFENARDTEAVHPGANLERLVAGTTDIEYLADSYSSKEINALFDQYVKAEKHIKVGKDISDVESLQWVRDRINKVGSEGIIKELTPENKQKLKVLGWSDRDIDAMPMEDADKILVDKIEKNMPVEIISSDDIVNAEGRPIPAGIVDGKIHINEALIRRSSVEDILESQDPETLKAMVESGDYAALMRETSSMGPGRLSIRDFLVAHERAHLELDQYGEISEAEINARAIELLGLKRIETKEWKEFLENRDAGGDIHQAWIGMSRILERSAKTGKPFTSTKDTFDSLYRWAKRQKSVAAGEMVKALEFGFRNQAGPISYGALMEKHLFGKFIEQVMINGSEYRVKEQFKHFKAKDFFRHANMQFDLSELFKEKGAPESREVPFSEIPAEHPIRDYFNWVNKMADVARLGNEGEPYEEILAEAQQYAERLGPNLEKIQDIDNYIDNTEPLLSEDLNSAILRYNLALFEGREGIEEANRVVFEADKVKKEFTLEAPKEEAIFSEITPEQVRKFSGDATENVMQAKNGDIFSFNKDGAMVIKQSLTGKFYQMLIPGATKETVEKWMSGELIQRVFPELTAEQREFLISGTTPAEFADITRDPEYDEFYKPFLEEVTKKSNQQVKDAIEKIQEKTVIRPGTTTFPENIYKQLDFLKKSGSILNLKLVGSRVTGEAKEGSDYDFYISMDIDKMWGEKTAKKFREMDDGQAEEWITDFIFDPVHGTEKSISTLYGTPGADIFLELGGRLFHRAYHGDWVTWRRRDPSMHENKPSIELMDEDIFSEVVEKEGPDFTAYQATHWNAFAGLARRQKVLRHLEEYKASKVTDGRHAWKQENQIAIDLMKYMEGFHDIDKHPISHDLKKIVSELEKVGFKFAYFPKRGLYYLTDPDGQGYSNRPEALKAKKKNSQKKTPTEGVDIDTAPIVKNLKGVAAVKAAEAKGDGVNVLRKQGNKHYGNPFSSRFFKGTEKHKKTIRASVEAYEEWLKGDKYKNIEPNRRQWILDEIDKGALTGKNLLYYTEISKKDGGRSHADALAKFAAERLGVSKEVPAEIPTKEEFKVEQKFPAGTKGGKFKDPNQLTLELDIFADDEMTTLMEAKKIEREAGDDLIVVKNIIDKFVDSVQEVGGDEAPYVNSKQAIQNDLRRIKKEVLESGGGVEEFLNTISEYAPEAIKPRHFEERVRQFFKSAESLVNRPLLTWDKKSGFTLYRQRAVATQGQRIHGIKSEQSINKILSRFTVMENGYPRDVTIELDPLDNKKAYFSSAQDRWIIDEPVLSQKDWNLMETQLRDQGYYIYSGSNNKGQIVTRRLHPGVHTGQPRQTPGEIMMDWQQYVSTPNYSPTAGKPIIRIDIPNFDTVKSMIEFASTFGYRFNEEAMKFEAYGGQVFELKNFRDELRALDPKFDEVMEDDINRELKRRGIFQSEGPERDEAIDWHEKKVTSNILYLMEENYSGLDKALGLFKDVIDFNKRQTLIRGTEMSVHAREVRDHVDSDGKLRFIIVEEDARYESDTDGDWYPYSRLFDDIVYAFGQDPQTGFMKWGGAIRSATDGLLYYKPGVHRASTAQDDFMVKHGITNILYMTSVKVKGDRLPTKIDFNSKSGEWELTGDLNVYKMQPSEIQVNMNVTDSHKKATGPRDLIKSMHVKLIPEQVGNKPIDSFIDDIFKPRLIGIEGVNNRALEWMSGESPYVPGTIGFGRGKIDLDDIGTKVILDIIQKHPTSEMTRDVLKFIFRSFERQMWEESEYGEEIEFDNAQSMTVKGVLEESNYDFSIWGDGKISQGVKKTLGNYIIRRAFKPRWKEASYMRMIGNTSEYRAKYNLKPGEWMVQRNWASEKINFGDEYITREEAFNKYNRAVQQKRPQAELDRMLDDLALFGGRVPVSGASGIRDMRGFRGFLKERGWGLLLHPEDKYLMGGADNDGDTHHSFRGVPKPIREAYRMMAKELEDAEGKLKNLKDPELFKKYFGIDEKSKESLLLEAPSSVFMPGMRMHVAKGSYMGNKAVGTVTNSSQMIQILLSTAIKNDGKYVLHKDLGKGKTAIMELEVNNKYIPQAGIDKVPGDTFRYMVYNAQNNTLDAARTMHSHKKIRQMLFDTAFKSKYYIEKVDPKTNELVREERSGGVKWNDLYDTEFDVIMDLNRKLFGYNFAQHRAWRFSEQLEAISNMTKMEVEFEGVLPRAAKEFGTYNFKLDLQQVVDTAKVIRELRKQNKLGEFEEGSLFLRLAGRQNLSIHGSAAYSDITLLLNDFHDWVATKDIIVPIGKRIRDTMPLPHHGSEYDILDEIASMATDFKAEGTYQRGKARNSSITQADLRHILDKKMINYREELRVRAEQLGLQKELLVKYFDAYMLSPLKWQNPEEWAAYKAELDTAYKIKDELMSGIPYDNLRIEDVNEQIKGIVKEMNMTSRQSVGWNSQAIPTETKANYRKAIGKALRKYYREEYKVEEPKEEEVSQLEGSDPEPKVTAEDAHINARELLETELKVDVEAADKLKDALGEPTTEEAMLIDAFTDYLKKYPNFANDLAKVIPGMIATEEFVGRPVEHLTWDDIRMFVRSFREMDLHKQNEMPVNWKHHYNFYSRLDEIMTPNDMRTIESASLMPVMTKDGDIRLAKTSLPMSMFKIIQDTGERAIVHTNSLTNVWRDRKAKTFGYLMQIDEGKELADIAIRSMERNGDGRSYQDQFTKEKALAIYKRRWLDVEQRYKELLAKGEVFQIPDKDGTMIKVDAEYLRNRIQDDITTFFEDFGNEIIYKPYNEADVIDDAGKLKGSFTERILRSIIGESPFTDITIEGNPAVSRLMYELDLEDLVSRKRLDAKERRVFRRQYRIDNPPPTEKTAVGKITKDFYFHHTGFTHTRAARKANSDAMIEYLEGYADAVGKGLEPIPEWLMEKVNRGDISESQAMDHMIYLKRQGYDRMKMGSLDEDMSMGEKTVEWLMTRSGDVENMHKLRLSSRHASSFSRGDIPLPEYRTDLKVLDDYVLGWSRAYFNNLVAIRARIGIDRFIERGRRGEHSLGKETDNWANMMLGMTKKIIGYPTFFPESVYGVTPKKGRVIRRYLDGLKLTAKQQQLIDEEKEKFMNERLAEDGPKALEKMTPAMIGASDTLKFTHMVEQDVNKLAAYRTGYYLYSDEVATKYLDKISTKLLGGKMPFYGELPKDPKTRKQVLARMVHKFGVLEGKYSLISLLSHFKTSIGNIMGGSENIISSAGLRHYKNSLSTQWLLDNIFQNATYQILSDKPGEKYKDVEIKTREDIGQWLEVIGVIDNYMKSEIGLDPTWRPDKNRKFITSVVKKISSMRRLNPMLTDKEANLTIRELGVEYGVVDSIVDKGAAFMQRSEVWLRQRAFLAHYLNAREALMPVSEELPWDSPVLIYFGKKGVEATQFMYHAAFRTNYSNTALGKVMTRFQPFAWNSIKFRRHIYKSAKIYGFKPGTKPFERYTRQMTTDMMALALGTMFVGSIFDYALPPPMSWMVDTAQWLFGDEKERERAFFSQWPTTAMAPLQPFTAPITRFPLNIVSTIVDGSFDKFSSYYIHTWYPFGRLVRDAARTVYNPSMIVENMTGLPLHRFQRKSTAYWKDAFGMDDEE